MSIETYFQKKDKGYQNSRHRPGLKKIADETMAAVDAGTYSTPDGISYELETPTERAMCRVKYYAPDSLLSMWRTHPPKKTDAQTSIQILEISTLDGVRLLSSSSKGKIAVLNFASAKHPGGGFLTGAQAQEESIARASTLYPTLTTATAQQFYSLHKRDPKSGFYSHAMIYSPGVTVFRDDSGRWLEPIWVDVLTSPAVNAGVVRRAKDAPASVESDITAVMKERMARILYLMEKEGAKHLVLGSFGTGVFQNEVSRVATLWADLLSVSGARFGASFDTVLFAVLGRKTFDEFREAFTSQTQSR